MYNDDRGNKMYNYIIGKVTEINTNMITLDNNGVGYLIHTPNPYSFNEGDSYLVYIYHHLREDESSLYGFKTYEEKDLFLKLLSVKGLGPKMALPIVASSSINGIADAINRENVLYLKKFPKIGDKLAKQIILDLKGKLVVNATLSNNDYTDELYDVLKGLGYNDKDIKNIMPRINKDLSLEEQIKEALKLMLR